MIRLIFSATIAGLLVFNIKPLSASKVQNADIIYDENIQSVVLYAGIDQLNAPVIRLGTEDNLLLAFDDMSHESYNFYYTIIHCTSNWETSDLQQMEYLNGFFEDEITNYAFSLNAIPEFVHYQLIFPNEKMNIKLSGNYIIKVYLSNTDDENVILTRRFFVVEQQCNFNVSIPYYPKNLSFTRMKQQIDMVITTKQDLFMADARQRIGVTIRQNGRWDNMITGIHPTSVVQNVLNFNFPDGIVFDGGNNFRNVDMKSFNYQSMYIRRITSEPNGYKVLLYTDLPKANKAYQVVETINGRKFIKARTDQSTAIEGEYAWVYFSLKYPKIEEAEVYLLGALNDWQYDEKSRMTFNDDTRQYEGKLFLKQGYYEYLYAVVPKGKTRGDVTLIEGDNFETDNQYSIYVYYRERVPEYDRLIGYYLFNSKLVTTLD